MKPIYSVVCNSLNTYSSNLTDSLTNGNFSSPVQTSGTFSSVTTLSGWTKTTTTYIINSYNDSFYSSTRGTLPTSVSSSQYLATQQTAIRTDYLTQSVNMAEGVYNISFYSARRSKITVTTGYATTQTLSFSFNGTTYLNANTYSTYDWLTSSYDVTVSQDGNYELKFTIDNTVATDSSILLGYVLITRYPCLLKYAIDWSFLPRNKKYKLSYVYRSASISSAYLLLLSLPDLNVMNNNFEGGNDTSISSTSVIGYISTDIFQTRFLSYYKDSLNVLCSGQTNNIFRVKITQTDGSYYANIQEYILTLHFEEIDD